MTARTRRFALNGTELKAVSFNNTLGDMDLDPQSELDAAVVLSVLLDNSTWHNPIPTNLKPALSSAIRKLAAYIAITYKES